jgi:hypothetical protein
MTVREGANPQCCTNRDIGARLLWLGCWKTLIL